MGHSIEDYLPYKGHLDASGIAAHLAMLHRVSAAYDYYEVE